MTDNIFAWTLRAIRRWPATALTLGMAAATGMFAVATNHGRPVLPQTSHGVAAVAAAPGPCYECGQYAGNVPTQAPSPAPAPLPSLHPTCTFRISAIPAGSVYLSTWGGPTCPRLADLLQKAEDRQLQGSATSITVSLSNTDPTTSGPPVCTQSFAAVMTWRVYATSSADALFARLFCQGLTSAAGGGQKTA
jgi:hypothetical protein